MNDQHYDVDSKETNVCPFTLQWAIGMNVDVALVNLTTRNRHLIAYACSHVIILYDYVRKHMTSLLGHQNAVNSLSASRDGKWLLSTDCDEDCACIVWDTETRVPICSLFNPHGKCCIAAAQLSPDARYLVTVGNEQSQILKFWLWTYGKAEADATVELNQASTNRVKKISFSDDSSNEFALTLNHSVIFISWTKANTLEVHHPKISEKNRRRGGSFNDSCYISKSDRVMTVTSNGFILVWGRVFYNEIFESRTTNSNERRLIKSIRLQMENLTRIEIHKEIMTIGNNSGHLYFYDCQLKLLYWCSNCGFDSIVSISFDRESDLKRSDIDVSESSILDSEISEETELFDTMEEDEVSEFSDFKESEKIEYSETAGCEKGINSTVQISRNKCEETKKNLTSSSITIDIDPSSKNRKEIIQEPTVCALQPALFVIPNFIVSSASGKVGRLEITNLKCRFIMHPIEGPVTAIATRPKSDYVATGNTLGIISLYKYTTRSRMVTKKTPALPNLKKLLNIESGKLDTTYATCLQIHNDPAGVSVLRFSPARDETLACGLMNGVIWMLHPNTLDPVDPKPFKHSASTITDIIFTEDGKYFAYSDEAFTVGVFKKNERTGSSTSDENPWNFLGKYRSHCMLIRQILFMKPSVGKSFPRLLSLGEDQNLVEYDLKNSGPYPDPGLKILQVDRIERASVPLCMAVYPEFGVETFLISANSEHKLRLITEHTKMIRITLLGPTFSDPIQQILLGRIRNTRRKRGYMIFATSKEIGLLSLPFDGNPYKIVAMIGHPKKIKSIAISDCGKYLYTLGENDRGVLVWKINYKSVNTMERLGGKDLVPFYSMIDGGKDGWLVNEMKDLFYYSQILLQGENTIATRIVSDKVSIIQLPNLMRAVGFYPTNSELETMMEEVSYGNYAETGQFLEEVNFEEFVKLYVNHRPAFGITMNQVKEAFKAFARTDDLENPSLTSDQFLEVLFGRGKYLQCETVPENNLNGEPLTIEEAHTYLRRLVPQDEDSTSYTGIRDDKIPRADLNFDFLPSNISAKTFAEEILGIEPPKV